MHACDVCPINTDEDGRSAVEISCGFVSIGITFISSYVLPLVGKLQ